MASEQSPEGMREQVMWILGDRAFHTERRASGSKVGERLLCPVKEEINKGPELWELKQVSRGREIAPLAPRPHHAGH